MPKELTRCQQIERSIITKFRKGIWSKFLLAIKTYEMIAPGDKIAVCISGGKDSMLLAKLFQELKRHSDFEFDVEYIVMNPGYNEDNAKRIEENAKLLEIPIKVFHSDIFEVTDEIAKASPCYLCARMRRGFLYAKAEELGCNKIALGHHKSDIIETTLMSMLYGGQIQGMLPRVLSTNFTGMELIRPMCCILEDDIIHWQKYNDLHFIACACRMTENLDLGTRENSGRLYCKNLIKQVREVNPDVDASIFKAIHNVQLDTLAGFVYKGERHSFLEKFKKDE